MGAPARIFASRWRVAYDPGMSAATSPPGAPGSPTVYYDGGCPVCAREIAMYRQQPGAEGIRWVDASTRGAEELGAQLSSEAALARLHLRGADGQLVSGAAAFTGMWQHLPRWRWLGVLFGKGWRLAALEGAYRGFLRVRRVWRRG